MRSRWQQLIEPWRALPGMPRALWILSLAILVNRLGTMVLPFLVIYLMRALGYSSVTAGLILAAYGAGSLVSGPLLGKLADKLGALTLMRASLVLSGLLLVIYPWAQSLPLVVLMTVSIAVANEGFRPASLMYVAQLVPPESRKSAFALTRLAINIGVGIGPAVGGFIAEVSLPSLFWIDGATTLAAATILLSVRGLPNTIAEATHATEKLRAAVFDDPRLRFCLLALIPTAIVFFQHEATMPLFMVETLGLTPATYGLMFTLNTSLIVLLEIPINHATIHWPHRTTLTLGALLTALGFGGFAFCVGLKSVMVAVVVWTFGEMVLFPGLSAYIAELAPKHRLGEYMGFYGMSFSVGFATGPALGTALLTRIGPTNTWLVMLALGLLSTFAMWRTTTSTEVGAPVRACS